MGDFPVGAEHDALRRLSRVARRKPQPHGRTGHGFGEDASDEVESVLDLALYFFWAATLFAGTTAVRVSHDEWLEVHGGDDLQLRQIEKHVGRA